MKNRGILTANTRYSDNRSRVTRYSSKPKSGKLAYALLLISLVSMSFSYGYSIAPEKAAKVITKVEHVAVPACGKFPDDKHSQIKYVLFSQLMKGK